MEIIPALRATRFEQLEAGDLFMVLDRREAFYALKTKPFDTGDRSSMVLLGPKFIEDAAESSIISWQPVTVVSLGKSFSILPSLNPADWSPVRLSGAPVCLAIADENTYICTNGGPSLRDYLPCFVEINSGAIVERRLPGSAMFTNNWEIAVLVPNHPPRSIITYPLHSGA